MSRANEFLELFSQLEDHLRSRSNRIEEYAEFNSLLNELVRVKKDSVVSRWEKDLKAYASLRNVLVHKYRQEPLADPRPDTINNLKTLLNSLVNPLLVRDIMVRNPTCFSINNSVKTPIMTMSSRGFTSVPIYDDKSIIGILSERSALNWIGDMLQNEENILLALTPELNLGDIQKYFDSLSGGDDVYYFVRSDQDAYAIRDMFSEAIKEKKRLAAVFVTHNGLPTEKLLGIVTAWDLHKVD